MNDLSPLFAFIHLYKCAGTAIRNKLIEKNAHIDGEDQYQLLVNQVGKGWLSISNGRYLNPHNITLELPFIDDQIRATVPVMYGHNLIMGLDDFFYRDLHYITIVRHPVERLISQYYFMLERKSLIAQIDWSVRKRDGTLRTLLEYAEARANDMTRFFTQRLPLKSNVPANSCPEIFFLNHRGSCDLESVKRELCDFYFVGFQEDIVDVSYVQYLLSGSVSHERVNATKNKKDVDRGLYREIEWLNSMDMQLYEYLLQLKSKDHFYSDAYHKIRKEIENKSRN